MPPRIALLAVAALFAGCSSLHEQQAPPPPASDLVQAAQLARYAQDLQTAVQGSPTEQAEVLDNARAGHDQAKQGPAALRYGLLLAAPGHPARDAAQARRLLNDALARPELLTAGERALAVVELARVDAELRLIATINRLTADLQQERVRQRAEPANAALNKRLQTEQEESGRLRKALDEAQAKLDALTRIERNFPIDQPIPKDTTRDPARPSQPSR